ncbi:MAG: DUF3106 domain-containing protein [Planctomycetota bacterium]|nr:DUF3106 domain-containing protein [Planctomycetota bacterium]
MKSLLLILALSLVAPLVVAQDGPDVKRAPAESSSKETGLTKGSPEGLDRWKAKTPEEQQLLRERFETLRALTPEQREALRERARGLEAERRELQRGLSPELQQRLGGLPPWERERILREQQLTDSKRRGSSLRRSLAPQHREFVEGLVEGGRPPHPDDVRHRLRGHFGDELIERMRIEGQLDATQLDELERLEGPERMQRFLSIERERLVVRVTAEGLPEGVTEKQWTKLQTEPEDERFMKRAGRLGLTLFDGPPRKGEDRGGHAKMGLAPNAPAWAPGFLEAMRPTLRDRIEVRDLEHSERKAAMDAQVASRMRGYLADKDWFPAERRSQLAELDDSALIESLEEFLEETVFSAGGRRSWHERGARPRGEPRGGHQGPGPDGGPDGRQRPGGRPGQKGDAEGPPQRFGLPPGEGPSGPPR